MIVLFRDYYQDLIVGIKRNVTSSYNKPGLNLGSICLTTFNSVVDSVSSIDFLTETRH